MSQTLAGVSQVVDRYDVLLCDVWGVIHNGREAFSEPCAVLARWRRERGPVVLISNSPRPADDVVDQLDALGVPREAWSAFVTSGDATRDLLAARAPGPAWRIGAARDAPLYDGLGLDFAAPETAAFISCTGPEDDEAETPEDYRAALGRAAARGLEMVCANPDRLVQRGDRLIYCAGALAALYETLGGAVMMAGKPFAPIYEMCLARASAMMGRTVDRRRVLAIGDGIATDLAGARAQSLDALFIASGIHAADLTGADGAFDLEMARSFLTRSDAVADFVMADLAW
ncbi:MAG TPA: TIGR01459 family HAD-type hydrolase [Caulobacteraceae bacterium]|nr:TIGR01459 family HAD-type hydrolase [Caulobacteraceae bacterium]